MSDNDLVPHKEKDTIQVSDIVQLNTDTNATCEYLGCSGDCDCDGD